MAADIAIVAVGMVAASQSGVASETITPETLQLEKAPAALERLAASPEAPQLIGQTAPQLDQSSIAKAPEFSAAVAETARQTTEAIAAPSLTEVEAAEAQLINAQLGQAAIALPVAVDIDPQMAEEAPANLAIAPPIHPATKPTAPTTPDGRNEQRQALAAEIADAVTLSPSPQAISVLPAQPTSPAIAHRKKATPSHNLYYQEAKFLQQQAGRITRDIPVPDAIATPASEAIAFTGYPHGPASQNRASPIRTLAFQPAQQAPSPRQLQATAAVEAPPIASPTPQAQQRLLSPERQFLAQVMMESAEAQFLESSGLGTVAPEEAASQPAGQVQGDDIGDRLNAINDNLGQVTSVSQLRDVKPTDWAFQASQSLVERYGCVSGYPDGSFRGDRSLSRYEFAAGLNACLERITELLPIAGAEGEFAAQADLAVAQQLAEQFEQELGQVRSRITSLEQRQADLDAQQFTTTTQLYGQTIFGLRGSNNNGVDLFPVDGIQERSGAGEVSLGGSAELTLASSFRGNDLLLTSLQAGNIAASASTQFTNMGRLSYEGDTNNQLVLSDLSYRFSATPNLGLIVGTAGVNPTNTFRGISPLEGSGDGALSRLGQRNPLLELGAGTGGAGFDWQLSRNVSLQGVYSATSPNQAGNNVGLFNGGYVAGGQVSAGLGRQADLGLHYLHSYSPNGSLGTGIGDAQVLSPFATDSSSFRTHAVGASAAWRASRKLILGGWGGWTSSIPTRLSGSVQTTNWMGFAQVNDLFQQGNALGLLVGQPPKITSSNLPVGFNFPEFSDGGERGGREDTALHLEAFYRAQLNENISLTPGIVVVRNPNHNADNDTLVVGAMRTTFRF